MGTQRQQGAHEVQEVAASISCFHWAQRSPMWPPYPQPLPVCPSFNFLAPKLPSAWGNDFNTCVLWHGTSLPLPLHSFQMAVSNAIFCTYAQWYLLSVYVLLQGHIKQKKQLVSEGAGHVIPLCRWPCARLSGHGRSAGFLSALPAEYRGWRFSFVSLRDLYDTLLVCLPW